MITSGQKKFLSQDSQICIFDLRLLVQKRPRVNSRLMSWSFLNSLKRSEVFSQFYCDGSTCFSTYFMYIGKIIAANNPVTNKTHPKTHVPIISSFPLLDTSTSLL